MNFIKDIQEGKEAIFRQVYNQYKERLFFYFLSKTDSSYLAQELVQQTFIKLWTYREKLKPELSLDIQLFRIARTSMIDLLRKKANEKRAVAGISIQEADNSLQTQLEARETLGRLNTALAQLPAISQKAFRLSREQGLTYHQIAETLSISPKTVEYHISNALRMLKKAVFSIFLMF